MHDRAGRGETVEDGDGVRGVGPGNRGRGMFDCLFAKAGRVTEHPGLDDPDKAYMMMVTHHLPTGMVGFMAVVMIATLVSSIDSGLNSFSTVLTMDIYVKNFRPNASQKEIQRLGRITTVLTALFAVLYG